MEKIIPRKKLSLGKININKKTSCLSSDLKIKIEQQQSQANEKNFLKNEDLSKLYQERKSLLSQIQQIERRLKFCTSSPLKELLIDLKKQDFQLLSKMGSVLATI